MEKRDDAPIRRYIEHALRQGIPPDVIRKNLSDFSKRQHNPEAEKSARRNNMLKRGIIAVILLVFVGVGSALNFSVLGDFDLGFDITGWTTYGIADDDGSPSIVAIPDQLVNEGQPFLLYVNATDVDGEDLEFAVEPDWISIETLSGATAGGIEAEGLINESSFSSSRIGNHTITVVVTSDPGEDSDSKAFALEITENTPPTFHTNISNMTWPEDTVNDSLNLSEHFNDSNNDTLYFTINGTANLDVSINDVTGIVTITPHPDWQGEETVHFTASDSVDTTDSNELILNVTNVYDAPTVPDIIADPYPTGPNDDLACKFNISDPDPDENITGNVTWYKWIGGAWVYDSLEEDVQCTANQFCYSSNITGPLVAGDQWNCTVNASDETTIVLNSNETTITNLGMPVVSNVQILPSPTYEDSNMTCNFTITDSDSEDNVTANVSWYLWDGGVPVLNFTEDDIQCTNGVACTTPIGISEENTSVDEHWNCTVNASDQHDYDDTQSDNVTLLNAIPEIQSLNNTANSTSWEEDNTTVIIDWYDYRSTEITAYVCNSSDVTMSGCGDTQLCNSTNDTNDPLNCTFNITNTTDYWAAVCDNTNCSSVTADTAYYNHAPYMNFTTETVGVYEGAVACYGDCTDTSDNKQSYIMFNLSEMPDSYNITNATAYFTITEIIGGASWKGNIDVLWVRDYDWTSSDTAGTLNTRETSNETSLTGYTSLGLNEINLTEFFKADADAYYNVTSCKLVSADAVTNTPDDSEAANGEFAVGDNATIGGDHGAILFNDVYANVSFVYTIPNQTLTEDTVLVGLDLDDYFFDEEGDDLNYTSTGSSGVAVAIDNDTGVVTLTPALNFAGTASVYFIAYDIYGRNATSNLVYLDVVAAPSQDSPVQTVQVISTGGGGGVRLREATLEIQMPSVAMAQTDKREVTMTLKNSGDVSLSGITTNFIYDTDIGLSVISDRTFFSAIAAGAQETATVTITADNVDFGTYEAFVVASVSSPAMAPQQMFFIEINDTLTKEGLAGEIRFVADLLKSNEECLELMEFVAYAGELLEADRVSESSELLKEVVDNCKYLIATKDKEAGFGGKITGKLFGTITGKLYSNVTVIIIFSAAILGAYLLFLIARRSGEEEEEEI